MEGAQQPSKLISWAYQRACLIGEAGRHRGWESQAGLVRHGAAGPILKFDLVRQQNTQLEMLRATGAKQGRQMGGCRLLAACVKVLGHGPHGRMRSFHYGIA